MGKWSRYKRERKNGPRARLNREAHDTAQTALNEAMRTGNMGLGLAAISMLERLKKQ